MGRFAPGSRVFDEKDVLREDWRPETLEERESEMDACATALQPVMNHSQPDNLFLYGLTGVGKTAATHSLIDELLDTASRYEVPLDVVELNCTGLTTSYKVAVNLVNEMRAPSHPLTTIDLDDDPIPVTGLPQKEVFHTLLEDLERGGETIIVILDEIDTIGGDDDLLYELPRARKNYDFDATLGLIGISNDFRFRENLSSKVKDSLAEKEVHFEPYDANQLRRILEKRAAKAFVADTVGDGVLAKCTALAAEDSGSARQALRLLRVSADITEQRAIEEDLSNPMITEQDVSQAEYEINRQQIVQGMQSLTVHGKFVLLTLVTLEVNGKTPERTKVIHQHYRRLVEEHGSDPLSRRAMHNHLTDLTMQGVAVQVDVPPTGQGGNQNHYEVDVPLESAIDALETEFSDEVESLRRAVRDAP